MGDTLEDICLGVVSENRENVNESISGKISTALDLFSGKQAESVDIASVFSMFCKQFDSGYKSLKLDVGQEVNLHTLATYIFYNLNDIVENAENKTKDAWKNQAQIVEKIPVSLSYSIGETLAKSIISAIENSVKYTVDPKTGQLTPRSDTAKSQNP